MPPKRNREAMDDDELIAGVFAAGTLLVAVRGTRQSVRG